MKKEFIGLIQGRNRIADIVAIEIWGSEKIFIDGIGQRGRINGGFLSMKPEYVEQVFVKWLEGRGFNIHKSPDPEHQSSQINLKEENSATS